MRPSINAGDGFGIPKWQVSFGATYNTAITANVDGYLRLDYQWQSNYLNGTSYGTANYNVFTRKADSQDLLNARAGVRFGDVDINVFHNNLLNCVTGSATRRHGKGACNAATGGPNCTVYTTWTPFVNQNYQRPRDHRLPGHLSVLSAAKGLTDKGSRRGAEPRRLFYSSSAARSDDPDAVVDVRGQELDVLRAFREADHHVGARLPPLFSRSSQVGLPARRPTAGAARCGTSARRMASLFRLP